MSRVVVPHAGTWIEMYALGVLAGSITVVPHAGTWIEIQTCEDLAGAEALVVPHAGTWIEISSSPATTCRLIRRSPRGNVDSQTEYNISKIWLYLRIGCARISISVIE